MTREILNAQAEALEMFGKKHVAVLAGRIGDILSDRLDEEIAMKRAQAAKATEPQPVAIRYPAPGNRWRFAGCNNTVAFDALKQAENLYLHPDPRIAEYRELLKRALFAYADRKAECFPETEIRAALKGGE